LSKPVVLSVSKTRYSDVEPLPPFRISGDCFTVKHLN
jgi:hypothetical protein